MIELALYRSQIGCFNASRANRTKRPCSNKVGTNKKSVNLHDTLSLVGTLYILLLIGTTLSINQLQQTTKLQVIESSCQLAQSSRVLNQGTYYNRQLPAVPHCRPRMQLKGPQQEPHIGPLQELCLAASPAPCGHHSAQPAAQLQLPLQQLLPGSHPAPCGHPGA